MIDNDFEYKIAAPAPALSNFVERFWMLANHSEEGKEIVILPDGRIDILFSYSDTEPFHVMLMGIESKPEQTTFPPKTVIFAVNLKLISIEYMLGISISDLINNGLLLPVDFWGMSREDLADFDTFCNKISAKISALLNPDVDERKQKLFDLIDSSNGSLTVKELSEKVHWSSRQINRYFNQRFGISLKAYCTILRFRASFQHIKEGKLFPEQNFTDQAHFIKEIKRLSGVIPKELFKNKNDRFIQLSTLPKE